MSTKIYHISVKVKAVAFIAVEANSKKEALEDVKERGQIWPNNIGNDNPCEALWSTATIEYESDKDE